MLHAFGRLAKGSLLPVEDRERYRDLEGDRGVVRSGEMAQAGPDQRIRDAVRTCQRELRIALAPLGFESRDVWVRAESRDEICEWWRRRYMQEIPVRALEIRRA